MYWNHRVMLHPDGTYRIHEVFHNEDDGVGWTANAIAPQGDTLEELRWELTHMLAALDKPFLLYDPERIITEIVEDE